MVCGKLTLLSKLLSFTSLKVCTCAVSIQFRCIFNYTRRDEFVLYEQAGFFPKINAKCVSRPLWTGQCLCTFHGVKWGQLRLFTHTWPDVWSFNALKVLLWVAVVQMCTDVDINGSLSKSFSFTFPSTYLAPKANQSIIPSFPTEFPTFSYKFVKTIIINQ